jgi:hypothetical protein
MAGVKLLSSTSVQWSRCHIHKTTVGRRHIVWRRPIFLRGFLHSSCTATRPLWKVCAFGNPSHFGSLSTLTVSSEGFTPPIDFQDRDGPSWLRTPQEGAARLRLPARRECKPPLSSTKCRWRKLRPRGHGSSSGKKYAQTRANAHMIAPAGVSYGEFRFTRINAGLRSNAGTTGRHP